jgi:hypothetical protein
MVPFVKFFEVEINIAQRKAHAVTTVWQCKKNGFDFFLYMINAREEDSFAICILEKAIRR